MARPGFNNHPKFKRLQRLLGQPRPLLRGCLELLWECAYECGDDKIGDTLAVEAAAEWTGKPGTFCRALVECGLLDEREGVYHVHDLFDHAPDYVAKRAAREATRRAQGKTLSDIRSEAGRKGALKKWGHGEGVANGGHLPSEHGKRLANAGKRMANGGKPMANGPTPAPAPAPFLGEESPKNPSCPELAEIPPPSGLFDPPPGEPPASAAHTEPPLLVFPTTGKGAKEWPLTRSRVAELEEAFPYLDVLAECRKALAWVRATPRKRKTAKGMMAFLVGWLGRCNDRGPPRGTNGKAGANGHDTFSFAAAAGFGGQTK